MSKRTVIVSGGLLEEDFALPILRSEDTEFIIGVDKGLTFLYRNSIKPDYIVGDFDSVPRDLVDYYREEINVPIREFNPVKDASDTEIALRLCLGMKRKEIWILGGTGNYTGEGREVLLCACSKSEAYRVKNAALEADEGAFLMFTETSEVFGEGFGVEKREK